MGESCNALSDATLTGDQGNIVESSVMFSDFFCSWTKEESEESSRFWHVQIS